MAGSVNKVTLIGNLGKDPEVRSVQSGNKIANMTLATGDSWMNKETGKKEERTEWHRVVIFDQNLVDVVEKYTKKGDKIYIEGKLVTRKWEDKDGIERYTTEIVLDKYNGVVTLLSARGGNSDVEDMGSEASDSAPKKMVNRGSMVKPTLVKPSLATKTPVANVSVEEDDEIPF